MISVSKAREIETKRRMKPLLLNFLLLMVLTLETDPRLVKVLLCVSTPIKRFYFSYADNERNNNG